MWYWRTSAGSANLSSRWLSEGAASRRQTVGVNLCMLLLVPALLVRIGYGLVARPACLWPQKGNTHSTETCLTLEMEEKPHV